MGYNPDIRIIYEYISNSSFTNQDAHERYFFAMYFLIYIYVGRYIAKKEYTKNTEEKCKTGIGF